MEKPVDIVNTSELVSVAMILMVPVVPATVGVPVMVRFEPLKVNPAGSDALTTLLIEYV
jgi:hypothetical protein